jgi:hypothetical protein
MDVVFYKQNAVMKTTLGTLSFYQCTVRSRGNIHCEKFSSVKTPDNFVFSKTSFIKMWTTLFVWGTDAKSTYLYAADMTGSSVKTIQLTGVAQDVLFFKNNGRSGFVAIALKDQLQVSTILNDGKYDIVHLFTINNENSGLPLSENIEENPTFCPRKL